MIETKLFFQMLFALLIIGTFTSLITGVAMPTTTNTFAGNITIPGGSTTILSGSAFINDIATPGHPNSTYQCYYDGIFQDLDTYTCTLKSVDTSWWGISALVGQLINGVGWVINSVISIGLFIIAVIGFFTGLGSILGTTTIPEPFNFLLGIGIGFAWMFLALDVISRLWVVIGRGR